MPASSVSLTGNAVSACNLIDDGWNFDQKLPTDEISIAGLVLYHR